MISNNTLGRLICKTHPEIAFAIKRRYHPMLKNFSHMKDIIKLVDEKFPDYGQFDRNVLIAACIYKMYCPATLLPGDRCQNAPAGMRDHVAELLGYVNATNINYWQDKAKSFFINPRFASRVDEIVQHFKHASINPADSEIQFPN